ncbi:type IV pilus biogenesis protein PilP [Acidovorax sp.]|uniref:type IV pilus biogenesis protein PilP n=1 Tax=Acidovorax sp. TaxID=1872122 RepID=UPI0025BA7951|nr:type IV pilus biogenesis protein PilP [Acidovorax sp.]
MSKALVRNPTLIACLAAVTAFGLVIGTEAKAQTFADELNRLEGQLQLLQKREQVNAALQRQVDPSITSLPQVVAVLGMEGDLKARLLLATGATLTYGEGDSISAQMKVASITPREVVVAIQSSKKKASKPILAPLRFMAGANQNGMQGLQGGIGMPGMPFAGSGAAPMPLPEGLLPSPPIITFGGFPPAPAPQPAQTQPASVSRVPAAVQTPTSSPGGMQPNPSAAMNAPQPAGPVGADPLAQPR